MQWVQTIVQRSNIPHAAMRYACRMTKITAMQRALMLLHARLDA
jgi:hypothetical protein